MVVGHDIAVGGDEEAGALADHLMRVRGAHAAHVAVAAHAAEALEELLDLGGQIVHLAVHRALVVVIRDRSGVLDLDANGDDRRLDALDDVGDEGRPEACRSEVTTAEARAGSVWEPTKPPTDATSANAAAEASNRVRVFMATFGIRVSLDRWVERTALGDRGPLMRPRP